MHKKISKILQLLQQNYPKQKIILQYSNSWELTVAVILSARCTDKQVNKVITKLFQKYKTISNYANADLEEFQNDIKSTGFFKNKAKHIIQSARIILDQYNGQVPETMRELRKLPGVGRKTANIILAQAFHKIVGIAVDTHVKRISERLGLTNEKNPEKIERDLMKLFDKKDWYRLTSLFIEHGRAICNARKPKCEKCFLNNLCPSAFKFSKAASRAK